MKKLFLLIFVALVCFALVERNRLYVRDPLAGVTHDGVKQEGVQVYINYPSDVLLENDNPLAVLLLQHNQHAGLPKSLRCLHRLACLADADEATLAAPAAELTLESMTGKEVRYRRGNEESVVALY